MKSSRWILATLIVAGMACVHAQAPETSPPGATDAPAMPNSPHASPEGSLPTSPMTCCRIAAGTQVELEITDTINSSQQKRGDRFALRLHVALSLDGATVVPAGVAGVGQVVHAAAARGGGKPGELLLAARYLEHGGMQVPLRSLKFGATGKDNTGVALGVSMAIGPFAHFIRGHEIEIPAGTIVTARIAQDVVLPPTTAPDPTAAATEAVVPDPPATATNQE